jgi:hypothetical protein
VSELHFVLDVEDDWPPVSIEGVPCTPIKDGYRVEMPPLFVKNISVGDIIAVTRDGEGNVSSWSHIEKSCSTTVWLLRMVSTDGIEEVLRDLRKLNCNTVQLPQYGCYAVDVPEECAIHDVDACLSKLDTKCVAVAYPSFRHKENDQGSESGL